MVNLYPFAATASRPGTTREECIEQIDIGGPSLVRAAAKNQLDVAVSTSPEQYGEILSQLDEQGGTTLELREQLAADAFDHTASYDRAIADYLRGDSLGGDFPSSLHLSLRRKTQLRYGENPHQRAAVYSDPSERSANLVSARQLSGKELSYNNLLDLDSALEIVRGFAGPAASVIKHNNPCGAATGETLAEACQRGLDGDPLVPHLVQSWASIERSTKQPLNFYVLPVCSLKRLLHQILRQKLLGYSPINLDGKRMFD